MITGAGSGRRRDELRLGHFAADRWQLSTDTDVIYMLVAEKA